MKYVCLVYHEEQKLRALPDDELESIMRQCGDWVQELEEGGHHVFSAGLQSVRTASTLRNRNGRLSVTDGPFSETKEFLGGFTILEARDLNEAIQLASKLPAVLVGTVEVRPLLSPETEEDGDPLHEKLVPLLRRNDHAGSAER